MTIKSTWLAAAFIGATMFVPATSDAQLRQSTAARQRTGEVRQREAALQRAEALRAAARQRAEAERAAARRNGGIFDRDADSDADSDRKRSCAKLSKADKTRCKELRKEEHRLAKLEKRRQQCLSKRQKNPSHPSCAAVYGTRSARTLPDVIYDGDVRRPRGTDPASGQYGRLPRSGL